MKCLKIWLNIILSVSVVWMGLTYESADWVKQTSLSDVGGPLQCVEGLTRITRHRKGKLILSACQSSNWDIGLLLPLDLDYDSDSDSDFRLKTWLGQVLTQTWLGLEIIPSPGSQAFGLRLGPHHGLSWVSILLTAGGGPSRPPNPYEPIPYNKSLYKYIFYCLHVSGEPLLYNVTYLK